MLNFHSKQCIGLLLGCVYLENTYLRTYWNATLVLILSDVATHVAPIHVFLSVQYLGPIQKITFSSLTESVQIDSVSFKILSLP